MKKKTLVLLLELATIVTLSSCQYASETINPDTPPDFSTPSDISATSSKDSELPVPTLQIPDDGISDDIKNEYHNVFCNLISIGMYAEHYRWHVQVLLEYGGVSNYQNNLEIVQDYTNPDNKDIIYEIYKDSGFASETPEDAIELAKEFSTNPEQGKEFIKTCYNQLSELNNKYGSIIDMSAINTYYNDQVDYFNFIIDSNNVSFDYEQKCIDAYNKAAQLYDAANKY